MKEDNKIATASSLSRMWDDGSIKRVRASEEPISLREKKVIHTFNGITKSC